MMQSPLSRTPQLVQNRSRFLQKFQERLAKFGFELHPDKTRLVEFGRVAARNRRQRGAGKPKFLRFWGSPISVGSSHPERSSSGG
jgi:RNA-directed DNA polymerase